MKLPIQLIFVSILLLFITLFMGSLFIQKETFVATPVTTLDEDIQVQMCPSGSESYFNKNGDVLCCRGSVVNGNCNGLTVCSLSSNSSSLPSCTNLLRKELRQKADQNCPKSMRNYFQDLSKPAPNKGCTAGLRVKSGKAPMDPNAKQCKIYNTLDDNLSKLDSCLNTARSEVKCFNGQLPKATSLKANLPAVMMCSFNVPNKIMPSVCYTDDSLYMYSQKWNPNWRQFIEPSDKLQFCSVAKKYFVDKSITEANLAKYIIPDYTLQDILKQVGLTY
jgi:hypothetical protein